MVECESILIIDPDSGDALRALVRKEIASDVTGDVVGGKHRSQSLVGSALLLLKRLHALGVFFSLTKSWWNNEQRWYVYCSDFISVFYVMW